MALRNLLKIRRVALDYLTAQPNSSARQGSKLMRVQQQPTAYSAHGTNTRGTGTRKVRTAGSHHCFELASFTALSEEL